MIVMMMRQLYIVIFVNKSQIQKNLKEDEEENQQRKKKKKVLLNVYKIIGFRNC